MGDMGDLYRDWKIAGQEKKRSNLVKSEQLLISQGVSFEKLSPHHFRVGEFDFWPSTGKFIHRGSKKAGRGILKLLQLVQP